MSQPWVRTLVMTVFYYRDRSGDGGYTGRQDTEELLITARLLRKILISCDSPVGHACAGRLSPEQRPLLCRNKSHGPALPGCCKKKLNDIKMVNRISYLFMLKIVIAQSVIKKQKWGYCAINIILWFYKNIYRIIKTKIKKGPKIFLTMNIFKELILFHDKNQFYWECMNKKENISIIFLRKSFKILNVESK